MIFDKFFARFEKSLYFCFAVRVAGNAEVRPVSVSGQGSGRTSGKGVFAIAAPLLF